MMRLFSPSPRAASRSVGKDDRGLARPRCSAPRRLALAGVMVATSGLATAQVHVDASSTHPNPDGKRWDTAWPTVREGLADTNLLTEGAMWVAKGVYSPSPPGSLDPPADTYTLPSDVDYFGGFLTTETSPDQRPSPAVGTILSGDLDGSNDANPGDTQHIVTIPAGASEITLDGFTIRHGYADLLATNGPSGAGILIAGTLADPVTDILFDEVRVKKCFAAIDGGGINATWVQNFGMKFCVLARNRANQGQGGGLRLSFYGGGTEGANIFSTQFRGNRAVDGGGLALRSSEFTALVYSCEFKNNNANKGGGIFIDNNVVPGGSFPGLGDLGNCTIVNNEATQLDTGTSILAGEGGGLYLANTDSSGVACFNSIVWSNTSVNGGILDVSSIEGPGASGALRSW